jgi:hypothetical protein
MRRIGAEMTIEEFIEKCQKRPLPSNPIQRIKVLARELAEGAVNQVWPSTITKVNHNPTIGSQQDYIKEVDHIRIKYRPQVMSAKYFDVMVRESLDMTYIVSLFRYFQARWKSDIEMPDLALLENLGYISVGSGHFKITAKSLDLLEDRDLTTIFISYKRSESSAFALLIEDRLGQAGLSPFLDKQLQAGDDWHATLEERIKKSDYLILLLGKETLKSEVTIKEIQWAIDGKVTIIPIWHNGFEFKAEDWPTLPAEISQTLANTHTIRVIEENPLTYDTALRELLNRFGISG